MSEMSFPELVYRLVDDAALKIVNECADHPSLGPFLVVMERRDFDAMMSDLDAPRWVSFGDPRLFPFYYNSAWICGLPIRVVPDGSWRGSWVEPYPIVMTQLRAQMSFGGEYG